ncbi:SMI1/KNR4 family protein [Mangrovivirga sp. M17]|uniref:SMI1/KNR4 family protein n=1 Tax=Mangrovivirga halotolerans TaxID=2993936 RepID=A0ABT3RPT7_9BACT|nr:SMI1/KNR4 family protein [Mangrovivirga halotolerans]MCX2743794.1 SMI1/KNR4 family protein [Mangrovivirga halotolerans]
MAKSIEQFEKEIFSETDGSKFSKLKNKLVKNFSENSREKVLEILMDYCRSGQLLHWRNFLLSDIIRLIKVNEANYIPFFEWAITQSKLTYWGIDGLLKTKGFNCYDQLLELLTDENVELASRSKAIKSLAAHSDQPFDRDLPKDPGYWKVSDLRIDEIIEWKENGYNSGSGYEEPLRHPSLDNPKTEFEKIVAKLDNLLKIERNTNQDLSNPSDWLTIADENKILEIEKKWDLPTGYLEFLKKYSPLNVYIDNDNFFQGLNLYGANDLIKRQEGYSYNPIKDEIINDWPNNFVVIAESGADPYCIDISDSQGAIYTSMHGTGEWEFEKFSESFEDFLVEILK